MNKPIRKGDWMQTATGRAFWPMDPDPADIDIEDIAHALSHLCRYAGHTRQFYSVAQHSVLVTRALSSQEPTETRLWGLLHDATEAYLVDVPRPLKRYLSAYQNIEDAVSLAIASHFGLPPEMPAEVKRIDNAILVDEMAQLMPMAPMPLNLPESGLNIEITPWSPDLAKREFLLTYEELIKE